MQTMHHKYLILGYFIQILNCVELIDYLMYAIFSKLYSVIQFYLPVVSAQGQRKCCRARVDATSMI